MVHLPLQHANQDGTLLKIEETDMSVPRSARSLSLERICL